MPEFSVPGVLDFIAGNLLGAFILSGFVRGGLKWLFHKTLTWKEEIAFWVLLPGSVLIVALGGPWAVRDRPNFRSSTFDRVSVVPKENASEAEFQRIKPTVFLLVAATIRNTGAPSIAENWGLTIKVGKTELKAEAILFPKRLTYEAIEGVAPFVYTPRDALYNKLSFPLPYGGRKQGVLLFGVENVQGQELTKVGSIYTLMWRDVTGRKYAALLEWPEVATGFWPYPGLEGPR